MQTPPGPQEQYCMCCVSVKPLEAIRAVAGLFSVGAGGGGGEANSGGAVC